MDSEEERKVNYIGEVRSIEKNREGKLLFQLGVYKNELYIFMKTKGDDNVYTIPMSMLVEPFVDGENIRCGKLSNCDNEDMMDK